MDNKFYVSLKAARLLKEKGYDEKTDFFIDEYGIWKWDNRAILDLPCPTKAEAIDWLESKGMIVVADEYHILHEEDGYYTLHWGYYISRKNGEFVCRDNSSNYLTRLEDEEAAIIEALELLEKGE